MELTMNNKFTIWLLEREDQNTSITMDMFQTYLGLGVLKESSFSNLQISDIKDFEGFRRQMMGWNAFLKLDEVAKNNVTNLINNQNTRMRDILDAMNNLS